MKLSLPKNQPPFCSLYTIASKIAPPSDCKPTIPPPPWLSVDNLTQAEKVLSCMVLFISLVSIYCSFPLKLYALFATPFLSYVKVAP